MPVSLREAREMGRGPPVHGSLLPDAEHGLGGPAAAVMQEAGAGAPLS